MLNIFLGTKNDSIYYVSEYFDATFEKEWFNSQLAKEIIKGIDDSEHIKDSYIESPVLGAISPRDLSSGCKGVLLLLNEDNITVCGERFGDNCFEYLFKVAELKDINITLSHIPHTPQQFLRKTHARIYLCMSFLFHQQKV